VLSAKSREFRRKNTMNEIKSAKCFKLLSLSPLGSRIYGPTADFHIAM
jgi:hypothetical protein